MCRIRKLLPNVFFTLLICPSLLSQTNNLPVFKQITHPFMPEITSQYFYFTSDGLLWFSTARGLTSFDGSEVVYYSTQKESNQYALTGIQSMAEDKEHNLYVGTRTNLSYFNRKDKTFTPVQYRYTDTSALRDFYPNNLFIDRDGTMYSGNGWNGMIIYYPDTKKSVHLNLDTTKPHDWESQRLNTAWCFAAHATDTSKLWIGSYNGIYLFNKKTKTFTRNFEVINPGRYIYPTPLQKHYDIQKMDVINDSTIWFNSYTGGFGRYNTRTGKAKVFLHDAISKGDQWKGFIIRGFARTGDGNYFLAVEFPHMVIFNTSTEKYEPLKISPPPDLFDRARYGCNDPQGNIWVLNKSQLFASMPDHYRLKRINVHEKIPDDFRVNSIYDVVYDEATQTYLTGGRTVDGVRILDKNLNIKAVYPTPLFSNFFLNKISITDKIAKDGMGRYWTTGLQTYILMPGQKKLDAVEKYFPSLAWLQKAELNDIHSLRDGNIALRKFSNGAVFIINCKTLAVDTFRLPEFRKNINFEFNSWNSEYDSSRNLLYTSNSRGMARLNLSTGKVDTVSGYTLLKGIYRPFSYLRYKLDNKGRIWIMVQAYGIRILNPDDFSIVDSIRFGEKGLPLSDCTDIRYGGKNKMLLKSGSGIIVYDYAENRSVFFDHNNGYSFQAPKNFLYCNNYLFIGQTGEVEYYNLDDFKKFNLRPGPHLNTIDAGPLNVFTRSAEDDEKVFRLRWHQNNLSFSFSATEFFFPERIEYAYQLTGVDKDWQYTHAMNRKINYSRLKPGNYVFRLMAQTEGGNWSDAAVEYTIVIVPAWWQTNGFKLACLLAATGLVFYFIRSRISTIRQKEKQKTEHEKELMELEAKALRAQMNPHFIFNSMNSIKALINKNENDKAADYLTTFSKLIRTLFQNSDKREVSLYEELETCKLYSQLEQMRFGNKVRFVFGIDEGIDLKDIKVPALIIQPFIENAIWHGLVPKDTGGTVMITVKENAGVVECSIDDDGIGRELSKKFKAQYEATHQSKGIGLTQSRLELDKLLNDREDTIRIIDKKDTGGNAAGTKVIITFKEQAI